MDKRNLRTFLGIREWLYFKVSSELPIEPITLCRVDTVTSDFEYLRRDIRKWTQVSSGERLNLENGDPFGNQWIVDMLEAFYG
jgi:hypothetical protein